MDTDTKKVDQVFLIWEEPEKNKENNLGKGQQSRKLVEKQELGRSRFPVLGGRQEYVWGLCYRAPIVSKCVEEWGGGVCGAIHRADSAQYWIP